MFPEGQLVAIRKFPTGEEKIVAFAASLIVKWHDYEPHANWYDFTDAGRFTNHDPEGKTLYGAEVMVDPSERGQGIGKRLYVAREDLTRKFHLKRIRAGARLRDYKKYAASMTPEEYTKRVIRGEIVDRTLSFQLRRGFHVLCIVKNYLPGDPESLGYAAVIEWINTEQTTEQDWAEYRKSEFYLE
jgi:GNAT superfamily N-acetyltransferase